jgi:hypothetical protein
MDKGMGRASIRFGRAKSILGDSYVYYRQIPGECLEVYLKTEQFWDAAVHSYWTERAELEDATRLEEVSYAMLPLEVRTNRTRFSVTTGA